MGLITKIFGTYSERQVKKITPIVDKIESLADEYKQKSDEQLREMTDKFKARLAKGETLPPQYHDHALTGDLEGTRDCHITPDWLLLYRIENDVLVLTLTRTGSHADLF